MAGYDNDSEQGEFIQAFVDEGREMLDNVEPLLIELEKISDRSSGVDPEVINTIFRLFHSLKGAAGFLNFGTVSKVTHEAETLLDLFRKGVGVLSSEHVDLMNRAADFIRQLLDNIESNLNDSGFEKEAALIVEDLKKTIAAINSAKSSPPPTPKNQQAPIAEPGTIDPAPVSSENSSGAAPVSMQLSITPEMTKQFTSEADELIESAEEALLNLEKEPNHDEYISQAFRSLHSLKGNAGFFGFADIETVSHKAESVLDMIRAGKAAADGQIFSMLLEVLDFLRGAVAQVNDGNEPKIAGKAGLISLMQDAIAKLSPETGKDTPEIVPIHTQTTPSMESIIAPQKTEEAAGRIPMVAVGSENIQTLEHNVVAQQSQSDRRSGEDRRMGDRRAPDKTSQKQSIRVDIEKLDVLMDLVGELVISEAMVSQNPDIRGLNISLERFDKSVMQLNKITRDLQDIATAIRMIPLSGTFRKMIRLVRDLAQKVDKKVELEIIGEETEVDKTVIEQINDPLVHIIRNSVDHGLETPEERENSNKSPIGHVTLEAKYVGGEVWILIKDDGKGLNKDRILSKAREKGLIEGDGSDLRDDQVWQMIFLPGFSTADKVTDVSGRGVGMDVVRRNIENIRGKVEVRSETGKGTSVILRIPLTLAIIDGMNVLIGGTRYIIPIVAIKESLRMNSSNVTRMMDGQEIVNIRGKLLPVVRMQTLLNNGKKEMELEDGIIVIVENENKTMGLFVDEVVGQQQIVIKGLSEYVGEIRAVSGCTIQGDGTISLIIDIAGIFALAEKDSKKIDITQSQKGQAQLVTA